MTFPIPSAIEILALYDVTANTQQCVFPCLFFQAVLSAAGRCHLLMGNWEAALGSAEIVLTKQPKDPKAILVKAEALFNLCYFELALMYFGRGQVSF